METLPVLPFLAVLLSPSFLVQSYQQLARQLLVI
jgi:hypothetical protein